MKQTGGLKVLGDNRKARFNYHVEESLECGIELKGTEVKSLRQGKFNFSDSFAEVRRGELYLNNLHITPYDFGNIHNHAVMRRRKLLAHKKEISRLERRVRERGYTLVPLKFYLKNSHVKVEIGVCKGKKLYDKRAVIKAKDQQRDTERDTLKTMRSSKPIPKYRFNLKQDISALPIVAFDLETTGVDKRIDKIIEIGGIKWKNFQIIDRFEITVNPGIPIPGQATKINGISDQMVASSPREEEVLPLFREFIEGSFLVAHNAGFDVGFLNEAFARHSLEPLGNTVFDTVTLARRAFPKLPSYALGNLAKSLSIKTGTLHRGAEDARVCLDIFIKSLLAMDYSYWEKEKHKISL